MKKTAGIFAMIFLLLGSSVIDHFFYRFLRFSPGVDPIPPYGIELPVYVIWSFLFLALAWYVLLFSPRSFFLAFVYLLFGAFALSGMSVFGAFNLWNQWVVLPPSIHTWLSESSASYMALTRHSAAMVIAIGLISLVPKKVSKPEPKI